MKLSVVIVSYNVRHYLEQCLLSVRKALQGIDGEIIVVDNHSKDGTVDALSERFPDVSFVESNHNLGFSRANNVAICRCRGEYVLLLNPDTVVGEHVLADVLAFMDSHPRAGSAGVQMLKADGERAKESRRGLPTPMTAFYKMIGLCGRFPKSKRFGRYYMSDMPWDEPGKIEVVSGAFCMLRRSVLNEVGLLDENFFMYGEDIDLSYRILKHGYENWYVPVRILHYKGESTQKSSFRYVHVFYEAMLIFFRKHYGHVGFWLSIPIRLAIGCKAFLALAVMMFRRLHRILGFTSRKKPEYSVLSFSGSPEMRDKCLSLAQRKGLAWEETDERKGSTYIKVFDAGSYSYEEMLAQLACQPGSEVKLGIWHPDTEKIITEEEVYE